MKYQFVVHIDTEIALKIFFKHLIVLFYNWRGLYEMVTNNVYRRIKDFLYNWKCLFQDVIILLKSIQRICISSRVTNIEYSTFLVLLVERFDEINLRNIIYQEPMSPLYHYHHSIFHHFRHNGWPTFGWFELEIGSDFCSWVTLFMAYLFVLMPHMKTTAKPLPPKSSQECNM